MKIESENEGINLGWWRSIRRDLEGGFIQLFVPFNSFQLFVVFS